MECNSLILSGHQHTPVSIASLIFLHRAVHFRQTLMGVQTAAIKEINEVFEIPAMTAKSLLQHFSWDKDVSVQLRFLLLFAFT